jgi:hypothetical protein
MKPAGLKGWSQDWREPKGLLFACQRLTIYLIVFMLSVTGVPLEPVYRGLPEVLQRPFIILNEILNPSDVFAVIEQVDEAEGGTMTFVKGDNALEATFTNAAPLDTAFWVVGGHAVSSKVEEQLTSARHVDDSTLLIQKGSGKAGAGAIKWQIVDFVQGASVLKGATSLGNNTATKTVTLPTPVVKGKSFVMGSRLTASKSVSISSCQLSYELSDESGGNWTTLTLRRGNSAKTCLSEWEVITFDNANIYEGYDQMTNGTGTAQATSGGGDFTSVTAANSFLVLSTHGDSGHAAPATAVRGKVTDGDTLDFTRQSTSGNSHTYWYLVEMTDGTTVQRSTQTFSSSSSPALGTTVDYDQSFALVSASGSSGDADDLEPGALVAANGQNINLTNTGGGSVTAEWQVITMPPIQVTYPNGGETFAVATNETITWVNSSDVTHVEIAYSTDGFVADDNIIVSDETADGSYTWTNIADDLSATVTIRISDETGGTPSAIRYDDSDGDLSIKGSITVTEPDNNPVPDIFSIAGSETITWNSTGTFAIDPNVDIHYRISGGAWQTIELDATSVASGTYAWNNIPDAPSAEVEVRVMSRQDNTVFGLSPEFEIRGSVALVTPITDAEWPLGRMKKIEWDGSSASMTVDLEYKVGVGNYVTIQSGLNVCAPLPVQPCYFDDTVADDCDTGAFCYHWTIPNTVPLSGASSDAKIKVYQTGNEANVNDISPDDPDFFKVVSSVNITDPNTGLEEWEVGVQQDIDFTITGVGGVTNVDVHYCTDFSTAQTWTSIVTNYDVTGCAPNCTINYTPIAGDISTDAGIRVRDASSPTTVLDETDNAFRIKGRIFNVTPTGGGLSYGTTNQPIGWDYSGNFTDVAIRISDGLGPQNYTLLTAKTGTTAKSWSWPTVDKNPATDYYFKVIALDGNDNETDVFGVSPAAVAIRGVVTVTYPTDEESFSIGVLENLTWTRNPATIGPFKVDYSTDSGANWTLPNGDTIAGAVNDDNLDWTVPAAALGPNLRIRVSLNSDPTNVVDTSDNDSAVRGSLTNLVPNTNVTWRVGAVHNITWDSDPLDQGDVNLVYSTNCGTPQYPEPANSIATVNSNASPYNWTVPAAAQGACRSSSKRGVSSGLCSERSISVYLQSTKINS